MAHQILGIDHVLISVANPLLACNAFSRLGFSVSPPLRNASNGTMTRFLVFGDDHVELVAVDGNAATTGGQTGKMTGVGLASRDLQASCDSLRRADLDVSQPSHHACVLLDSGETEECFCSLAALPDGHPPGMPAFLCHHPKFDIVRRSQWQDHPNTAKGIVSLTVLLENPEAAISDYNRLFGPAASTPTDETVTVHTGHGLIFLVTAGGFDDLHPSLDVRLPAPPAMAVLTIGVADIGKTAKILAENGVPSRLRGGHLGIPAQDVLGIGLEFVEM